MSAADAEKILASMRQNSRGNEAAIIGEVVADQPGRVFMKTTVGGFRIVDVSLLGATAEDLRQSRKQPQSGLMTSDDWSLSSGRGTKPARALNVENRASEKLAAARAPLLQAGHAAEVVGAKPASSNDS